MIYFLAGVAAIAGLLFGYDEGVIAVASPSLQRSFPMSAMENGFTTAAVPLGALVGAILAGKLTERLGRRLVLMLAAALFALGALAAAIVETIWMLMLARLVLGLAIGVAAVVAPLFIAEAAPLRIRGALVSTYQLAITAGIVLSYLTGLVFGGPDTWRVMFALGAVPGLVFLIGLLFLPESPRWLVLKNRDADATASLHRLRGTGADVAGEVEAIHANVLAEQRTAVRAPSVLAPWVRPALIIGTVLYFLQQLSGINAVIYYAPTIFQHAGLDGQSTQVMATVGVGLVNFVVTILAMMLIDRWGRRPLLVAGFIGTAATLLLIALAVVAQDVFPSWIVVVALFGYIASFAISLGPLPHLMMSEVFPLSVRGAGMSISSVSNWGFNFIVVFLFPLMLSTIGLAGAFTLFAVVCLGGILFTMALVPETRGVSLEEIEAHLRAGEPLSALGVPNGAAAPAVAGSGTGAP
jgi:SP family galactose:H+ symporter-like MFS transporter